MREILAWTVLLTSSCILTADPSTHVDEAIEHVEMSVVPLLQIRGSFISLQEPTVPALEEEIATQPSQKAISPDEKAPQGSPPVEPVVVQEPSVPTLQEEIAAQPQQKAISSDEKAPQESPPAEPVVVQEPATSALQAESTGQNSQKAKSDSPPVPQIRGVLVPSQESSSTKPIVSQEPSEPTPQVEDSLDRWPEAMKNVPEEPVTPKAQIHGVVVPLQEASSVESTLVETPIEKALQKEEEAVVVKMEEKSAHRSHASQTIIFSAPEISSVKSIEVVSENREVPENKATDEPIKRNVFANITIAALSAAVIFVSAILGSH